MALTPTEVAYRASELYELRMQERKRLDRIRMYLRGKPELTFLPPDVPRELQAIAMLSRVPLMGLIIKATVQQMFVDGYDATDKDAATRVWTPVGQATDPPAQVHRGLRGGLRGDPALGRGSSATVGPAAVTPADDRVLRRR